LRRRRLVAHGGGQLLGPPVHLRMFCSQTSFSYVPPHARRLPIDAQIGCLCRVCQPDALSPEQPSPASPFACHPSWRLGGATLQQDLTDVCSAFGPYSMLNAPERENQPIGLPRGALRIPPRAALPPR
jgi:hypothetical protein